MAATDLKSMTKSSLQKNELFFEAVIDQLKDLHYQCDRFGISCNELLVKQIEGYIEQLDSLGAVFSTKN